MDSIFFEVIGVVLTIGGLAIAFISLKHKFKTEEQKRHKTQLDEYVEHSEWKKRIEFDIETIKKETAELRHEREKSLTEVWGAIKAMQNCHQKDMKEVNLHIGDLIKEIRNKNEEDHCQLKDLLTEMKETIIEIRSDFKNHVTTHDLVKKTRSR